MKRFLTYAQACIINLLISFCILTMIVPPSFSANFYWRPNEASLSTIAGMSAGDQAIVGTDNGVTSFYHYNGASWIKSSAEFDNITNTGYGGTSRTGDLITKGPWVDVRAYGAVGNGTTDDYAAIQAAIDNTPSGYTLYFPATANYYRVTDTPTVTKAIHIKGDGWRFIAGGGAAGSIIRQEGGATKDALRINGTGGEIDGLVIENIALGGTSSSRHALHLDTVINRSSFRNIALLGAGTTGLKITGQAILNRFDHVVMSMGFTSPAGYAVPTKGFDLSANSGVGTWTSCGAAGVTTPPGYGWHLNGSNSDVFIQPESENNTVGWQCDNCAGNAFLWAYHEGNGTVFGGSTNHASNASFGTNWGATLELGAAFGVTLNFNRVGLNLPSYFHVLDNTAIHSLLSPHTAPKGSLHASRTGVTAVTTNSAEEGGSAFFAHTDTNLADVLIAEFNATGALADVEFRVGAGGSYNVGDAAVRAYRRSTGGQRNVNVGKLAIDVVTDATLPAAGASENGRIVMNSSDNTFVFYFGGARYKVTGTGF